ncbi:hypothetical protein BBI00_11345 [Chryseobacterium arthrosphaerae]|uniref:Uncharacterized protein n=2 Tax=Chryseobacterium arthrosphaerae TaxID=651561 RepID=A0A1B8ZTG7_9FLAO|nr:hypothetical protein BBI00_11345 [Chryseobacterium arthrosphaerae]
MGKSFTLIIMDIKEFKNKAIEISLNCVDKAPEDWLTFNDKINTQLLDDSYESKFVSLEKNELPILDCSLNNSYLLVTTERIISIIDNNYEEVYSKDFERLCNDYEKFNYKKENNQYPKTNFICIEKTDKSKLLAIIDSYYPAFFSKMLICNVLLYKKEGRWFLNPSKKL